MIGEVSIGGIFAPSLLLAACAALVVTALLSRLLSLIGLYRLTANRPATDIALFVLVLAALVRLTESWGLRA